MPEIPPIYNTKRIAIFLTLVTLLASVYMFTYSGRIESSDTLGLFDATSSLVQYGDGLLDSSAWYTYPPPSASGQYPLVWTNSEPLQPILAMPLFWVAYHLPGVGLVHAVWLFNILVCSVAGGVFYLYALVLGYGELTAVLGALLLGLCTIIWPYSKTFFREPLALLMILLAALFIECWRLRGYRSWVLLFAALLSLAGGYFSKEAVVFAVPALLVIAAPEFRVSSWVRRVFVVGGAAITSVFIVVSIFPTLFDLTSVYTLIANVSGLSLDICSKASYSFAFLPTECWRKCVGNIADPAAGCTGFMVAVSARSISLSGCRFTDVVHLFGWLCCLTWGLLVWWSVLAAALSYPGCSHFSRRYPARPGTNCEQTGAPMAACFTGNSGAVQHMGTIERNTAPLVGIWTVAPTGGRQSGGMGWGVKPDRIPSLGAASISMVTTTA